MARPLRIEFDGAWYHVMNRGAGHRSIVRRLEHQRMFLKLLGDISRIYSVEIHAHCLMENHYHLQIHTPNAGLGRAMRHLDGVYTQHFNRSTGTDGPLFRGRYKSILLGSDSYLNCVSRYIHLNPVDAGLVARPEDFKASSYRAYLGLETAPWWLRTAATLDRFGPRNARQNYRRFVEAGIDRETRAFFEAPRRRPVFGSDKFAEQIEELAEVSGATVDPERPECALLKVRPELEEIGQAVCLAFGTTFARLRVSRRHREGCGTARGAFVLLGREVGGVSVGEIARWIGYSSAASASKSMERLVSAMRREAGIRERVERARRELASQGVKSWHQTNFSR